MKYDTGDVCKRCGLLPEPATWYCGRCWYIVEVLRDLTGYVFDSDGQWDESCLYVKRRPT